MQKLFGLVLKSDCTGSEEIVSEGIAHGMLLSAAIGSSRRGGFCGILRQADWLTRGSAGMVEAGAS